jgi:hypothetical protein
MYGFGARVQIWEQVHGQRYSNQGTHVLEPIEDVLIEVESQKNYPEHKATKVGGESILLCSLVAPEGIPQITSDIRHHSEARVSASIYNVYISG